MEPQRRYDACLLDCPALTSECRFIWRGSAREDAITACAGHEATNDFSAFLTPKTSETPNSAPLEPKQLDRPTQLPDGSETAPYLFGVLMSGVRRNS